MSSPAQVPSKAAIHALRGLLLGTSCSLVLLAEERRQRIAIARSAVENGRKLKGLKQYSSSGAATLEALREKVLTDPRSTRSRSSCSHEARHHSYEGSYLDHVAHDLGPDPRLPTRDMQEIRGRSESASVSENTTGLRRNTPPEMKAAKQTRTDSFPLGFGQLSSTKPESSGVHDNARLRCIQNQNALATIMDLFWEKRPHLRLPEEILNLQAGSDQRTPNRYTSSAALALVRRAYSSISNLEDLPDWLIELSSRLSIACKIQGEFEVAARILYVIAAHGPIKQTNYFAHQPIELITSLIANETLQELNGEQLSQRFDLAERLYAANITDLEKASDELQQKYSALGKRLIHRALQSQRMIDFSAVFDRAITGVDRRRVASDTIWFMRIVEKFDKRLLAIDTFLSTYANLEDTRDSSPLVCKKAVNSVVRGKGYAALEVLGTINQLRQRDAWNVPSSWVEELLRTHWKSLGNYERTRTLFSHVLDNNFYDMEDAYAVRRCMVEICNEANDITSARAHFEKLMSAHSDAQNDVAILCSFAFHKASLGDWDGVRADFEKMKALQPFPENQRKEFNRIFVNVLSVYSENHTWGEVETFLETYVLELGVRLDRYLVNFIAHRHGKCRDAEALGRWLKFCKASGFDMDTHFWQSLLWRCKHTWEFSNRKLLSLYRGLVSARAIESGVPEIERCIKDTNPLVKLNRLRLNPYRVGPADETKTFERMVLEAQNSNWEGVVSVYNRAVHYGMGHSSRCFKLLIQANVHTTGHRSQRVMSLLHKAQSEGHDISEATIPVVLAQLNIIEEQRRDVCAWAEETKGRGRPYKAISGLLADLQRSGIHVGDGVLHRAARICLNLRNYREALIFCTIAAETSGNNDLMYCLSNFTILLQVFTIRHQYNYVRYLMVQLKDRDYRLLKPCRRILNWAIHYLKVASQTDKADELKKSDLEILADVTEVRRIIGEENPDIKAELKQKLLRPLIEDDSIQPSPAFLDTNQGAVNVPCNEIAI